MDTSIRVGWTMVVVATVSVAGALLQAQGNDPIVRLGPEIWVMIAGVLVTIGINLEQLRRVRSDVRDIKVGTDKKHEDNSGKLNSLVASHERLDRRIDHMETEFRFLRRRRQHDDATEKDNA